MYFKVSVSSLKMCETISFCILYVLYVPGESVFGFKPASLCLSVRDL